MIKIKESSLSQLRAKKNFQLRIPPLFLKPNVLSESQTKSNFSNQMSLFEKSISRYLLQAALSKLLSSNVPSSELGGFLKHMAQMSIARTGLYLFAQMSVKEKRFERTTSFE